MNATGLFITGTDTDVGKTFISAWLTLALRSCYFKPIQCGSPADSDTIRTLAQQANNTDVAVAQETYRLQAPLSPHKAAAQQGIVLSTQKIVDDYHRLAAEHTSVVVEGAGGVMVPINQQHAMIDVIAELHLPTLLVARGIVGTINHTWLTALALQQRSVDVIGIVISGELVAENDHALTYYTGLPVIAHLPTYEKPNGSLLQGLAVPEVIKRYFVA